jgi:TolB protein
LNVSRLNRLLLLAILGLLLLVAALVWRGERAGAAVSAVSPARGAEAVSGLAPVRITFGQSMDTTTLPQVQVSPAVSGTVSWEDDDTLLFRPTRPLAPERDYTVQLAPGAQSAAGRPVSQDVQWQFRTRATRLLYLGWDERDRAQLYAASPDGTSTRVLTEAALEVLDYALSPDGQTVVYSSVRQNGGSDLWTVAHDGSERGHLLECPGARCSNATWTPEGRRIVYERRPLLAEGAPPGPPRLWWLDPLSGETTPLFSDDQLLGLGARFSPGGRWISYVVPLEEAIQIYDLETGQTMRIPNGAGEPAVWHPWQSVTLVTDIQYEGEAFSVHIFRVSLPSGELTNISDQTTTNDGAPAWSPDAEWIAFGRKVPRAPVGRQIWLMRPDGSDALRLTNDPQSHFGPPAWSPQGTELLFQRYDMADPAAEPEIWRLDVAERRLQKVTGPGYQPSWLP